MESEQGIRNKRESLWQDYQIAKSFGKTVTSEKMALLSWVLGEDYNEWRREKAKEADSNE